MNIATPEWASMQSMFMLGMCAGGVLGGWLSDTYGRKITFLGGMSQGVFLHLFYNPK